MPVRKSRAKTHDLAGPAAPADRLRAILDDLPAELAPPDPRSPPGRILAAARVMLAEQGPAGLSLRPLARRAGVNQAMINYYFGTKDRLIDTVVEQEILRLIRDVLGGLRVGADPADLFVEYPLRLLDVLRDDPARRQLLRLVLATEPDRLGRVVRGLGRSGVMGLSGLLLTMIAESQEEGRLAPVPAISVLMFLIANAYGLVLMEPIARQIAGFDLDDAGAWKKHRRNLAILIRRGIQAAEPEKERP